MRFHDFHLSGYTVSDFGGTIVLELVYDYPDQPREISRIRFSDVAAYHFIHTGGAIIVDIAEVSIPEFVHKIGDQLAEWWQQHGGYPHWSDDQPKYIETLEQGSYHAWTINSAVGFEGFVIAKTAAQTEDKNFPKT